MKVAIIMPLAEQRGGAEIMLMHLLQANLHHDRLEYHIVLLEHGPMVNEIRQIGYPVDVFPAGNLRDVSLYTATVVRLWKWFRFHRFHGVMSWMAKAHLYAGPAAYFANIPAVWWQHGIANGHWMDRLVTLLPADSVFCCSKAAQRAQEALRPGRPTQVINPAVDLVRFDPQSLPSAAKARAKLGLPEEGMIVGIVARLQRWKGIHLFIEAAAQVAAQHPNVHFVVVGGAHFSEPEYPKELVRQIHELNVSSRVYFAGYQPNTELWIQAMDVVVHSSTEPEPFGMVIIEAMALGKLVIASRYGGPLEIVEDGMDGKLVDPHDIGALAGTIEKCLNEVATNHSTSRAARDKAKGFGIARLAAATAHHLRNVCNS